MAGGSPKKTKNKETVGKVIVKVDHPEPTQCPLVVAFPGGLPPSVDADAGRPKFVWQRLNPKSTSGRVVKGEDKHCVFSSQAKGLAYDDRRTKFCVGVYDKKRNVLTLHQAASRGTIFSLEQNVPSYTEKNGVVDQGPNQNILGYSTQVFEDFGSAKKQKVLRSQAANQVDIDHVVGAGAGSAVVHQVVRGEGMSESNRKAVEDSKRDGSTNKPKTSAVEKAYEVARRNFLPAYDENAVKPYLVYSARDIAGESAWTRIFNIVNACTHKDDVEKSILESIQERDWASSVVKLVKEINPSGKDAKNRFTCAILANWAIKFYIFNQKKRQIIPPNESKTSYFGVPIEVALRWVSLFTTSVTNENGKLFYAMSKQDKDKCVVHALLLYMMAQGPAMKIGSLAPVAKDLKVAVNDCANVLRLAGCTVTKKGTTISVALKTPLTFPNPMRGGGPRR